MHADACTSYVVGIPTSCGVCGLQRLDSFDSPTSCTMYESMLRPIVALLLSDCGLDLLLVFLLWNDTTGATFGSSQGILLFHTIGAILLHGPSLEVCHGEVSNSF